MQLITTHHCSALIFLMPKNEEKKINFSCIPFVDWNTGGSCLHPLLKNIIIK